MSKCSCKLLCCFITLWQGVVMCQNGKARCFAVLEHCDVVLCCKNPVLQGIVQTVTKCCAVPERCSKVLCTVSEWFGKVVYCVRTVWQGVVLCQNGLARCFAVSD